MRSLLAGEQNIKVAGYGPVRTPELLHDPGSTVSQFKDQFTDGGRIVGRHQMQSRSGLELLNGFGYFGLATV